MSQDVLVMGALASSGSATYGMNSGRFLKGAWDNYLILAQDG